MATTRQELPTQQSTTSSTESALADVNKSTTRARMGGNGNGAHGPGLSKTTANQLARGLGWFSVGLGLAELFAPRQVAAIAGVSKKRTGLIRMYWAH
jgi:hypothetical protein